MLFTITMLVLACSAIGKPIDKIKETEWREFSHSVWTTIRKFGLKAGRTACTPILTFYYVMSDDRTSAHDKALVCGSILYIISPFDLLPRKALGILGMLDDATVTAFVLKKIQGNVTSDIKASVEATLDEWFGTSHATC